MRIRTEFIYPPIPDRRFDWCAVDDETYDQGKPVGYGPTREAAIRDLLEELGGCGRCNCSGEVAVSLRGDYRGPGPVPEDARGVCAITCPECQGEGLEPELVALIGEEE